MVRDVPGIEKLKLIGTIQITDNPDEAKELEAIGCTVILIKYAERTNNKEPERGI